MTQFDIAPLILELGESMTMSGVSHTYNDYGDATKSYTAYIISGIVQQVDEQEEAVQEGLLKLGDVMIFIDENEPESGNVKIGNEFLVTKSLSGVFYAMGVVKNEGHYEVMGKRLEDTSP